MRKLEKHRLFFKPKYQRLIILFSLSTLIVIWLHNFSDPSLFTKEKIQVILYQAGWFAPFIYISILICSVVISHIPAIPLVMVAGMIWSPWLATFYSVIGGFLGGLCAYFLGRSLGRNILKLLTGKVIYLSKDKGEIYLGFIIFLTRLIPFFSFDLISYGSGLSGISLPIYASSTLIGMIPPTALLTYMGSNLTLNFLQQLLILIFLLLSTITTIGLINRFNILNIKDIIRLE